MRVGLFLGAGASVPYGYKSTVPIKKMILNNIESLENPNVKKFTEMLFTLKQFPDVEYMLDLLYGLKNFYKSSDNNEYKNIKKFLIEQLSIKSDLILDNVTFDEFIELVDQTTINIKNTILTHYQWNDNIKSDVNKIFGKIYDVLKDADLHIFTTNYDSVIENFCYDNNIKICDGFEITSQRRFEYTGNFNSDADKCVKLYKLHGSLSWQKHNEKIICATDHKLEDMENNVIIYPYLSPKEYESSLPFDDLIAKFKEFMDDATNICIVIGFSFRDFKDIFAKFLNNNGKLIIISEHGFDKLKENIKYEARRSPIDLNCRQHDEFYAFVEPTTYSEPESFYYYPTNINLENIDDLALHLTLLMNFMPPQNNKSDVKTNI